MSAALATSDVIPAATAAAAAGDFDWRTEPDAPLGLFEAQGAAANGKLYVIGGFYNDAIQATAEVNAFDPAAGTWSRRDDMPQAFTHAGQAVDGDLI